MANYCSPRKGKWAISYMIYMGWYSSSLVWDRVKKSDSFGLDKGELLCIKNFYPEQGSLCRVP